MVYKVGSKVMHRMHTVISGHAFKSLDNSEQVYRIAAYTQRTHTEAIHHGYTRRYMFLNTGLYSRTIHTNVYGGDYRMSKSILIEIKHSYGRKVIYPACNNAEAFAKLTGCKTLTTQALELIEQLGYTIDTITPDWR